MQLKGLVTILLCFLAVNWPWMTQGAADQTNRPSGRLVIVSSFPPSLFQKFSAAFNKHHPEIDVFVRSKKTSSAISFIEERLSEPVDLFWASAPDAFEVLKESGHLSQAFTRADQAPMAHIGGYPIDDPDGYYRGFAVSGYGIVWNRDYLARYGLATPKTWTDLTDPAYGGHIGISAPSRSGTTHLIVESILQSHGWDHGWALLMEIGGNLATITARSFGVIEGVRADRFGIGAAIDFLGQAAKASGAAVDFAYPDQTALLPANIAIVKRSANPRAAQAFVDFVLSDEGQKLLFDPDISRLPVTRRIYDQAPEFYPDPFGGDLANKAMAFDADLSRRRYHLVNSLFDVLITFRLQALRRTWRAIHDAEQLLSKHPNPELQARVKEARRQANLVPVSAVQATVSDFASQFVRHKPGIPVPIEQVRQEAKWAVFARTNQDKALALANEVLAQIGGIRPARK
ncbi:ABC transporter substrate-binding protein [Magnetospira sp. QH-2]|uniref:ABC transporter substrate-binding protein n=1 Tax=Magnetospira sp. (strain QH-2) TaxID=1288970 RepID=UPI0003E810D1|nr:extracellular solute-binding protein [Magnetospira sp. QH-2]CCQ74500.1 ABC-type Fe3+ transport system extracellular solute-binding protein, family 1 [Magnetospira sp. QH-2]